MKEIVFGDIEPEGKLREQLLQDFNGCIGHLEELGPMILCEQNIYGKDRLTVHSKQAELGRTPDEQGEVEDVPVQYMWWNSESQSNWKDGFCRGAMLLKEEEFCKKVEQFVEEILSTQDENGYLGIYGEDLRYAHQEENGELWAKSTLFRWMLAYYEGTGSLRVFEALKRAFADLMQGYVKNTDNPFKVENSFSGHCHGLTIVDSLYEMYLHTEEEEYLEYAIWLYENYSQNDVSEEDLKKENLLNPEYMWKNHGVHLYEQMRAVIIAALHRKEYSSLLDRLVTKLPYYLTPSGAPIGDEWVGGRTADATTTGYEFCSVLELFDTYGFLLRETGELAWADAMEWLYYNGAMGMKHPTESSIMYCKTDNCYTANRKRRQADAYADERYKYSPVHQTTAVCCVPNMGRLTPHYVQNMYIRKNTHIVAALFGESMYHLKVNGVDVSICQKTNYPAGKEIRFEITTAEPVEFTFSFRVPKWAEVEKVSQCFERNKRMVSITRTWSEKQEIKVVFSYNIRINTDFNKDVFLSYGPLLYAIPIAAKEYPILQYDRKPFREVGYESIEPEVETYCINEKYLSEFIHEDAKDGDWKKEKIQGVFWNGKEMVERTMVPMGATILRKVTFEKILE